MGDPTIVTEEKTEHIDIDSESLVVEGWGSYFLIASFFTKKTEEKLSVKRKRGREYWKEKKDVK